jgi:hypothetical protein
MEKYRKLISLLINYSDCVTFQIEAYEFIFTSITEDYAHNLFDIVTNFSIDKTQSAYISFKKRLIKNQKRTKTSIKNALKSLKTIEDELLFRILSKEYGVFNYNQDSRNLIIGYKLTERVHKYLNHVKGLDSWKNSKPSDISFYNMGKCIFQYSSSDKLIYISNKELFENIKALNFECELRIESDFHSFQYPYQLNVNI